MSRSMKFLTATAVLAAMLAAPLASVAQDAPKKPVPAAKAAPPAAKPAPAARPAAPPPRPAAQARPAPPPRPAPAARVAPPHPAPQRAAAPPRTAPQRSAAPIRQAPPVNRAVREEHRQQRIQTRPATVARPNIQTQPTTAARPNIQAQPTVQSRAAVQPSATTPQQQRAERALRRRENSELRKLPPQQRAVRREEIQRARQQRALGTQQAQPNALTAQPKTLTAQPNALQSNVQRTSRRNGQARVTTQAAQQGRFASRLATAQTTSSGRTWRGAHMAAHRAWRRGLRAGFVPWYGPVFWPYAYSDVFDYAFWPDGYDDGFWDYAYDDFVDGLFWGEAGPPTEYAYAEPGLAPTAAPRATYAGVQELCKAPGTGITAWPFADIEKKVGLNADQKVLLTGVRKAGQEAAAVFKASCPPDNTFPLTPPGRLQAMSGRLQATLQAVQTVRPALEKFYDSLSDEQKERFNELGPKKTATNAEASAAADSNCKEPKPGLSNLPIEKIEDAVKPTDAQAEGLNKLEDATNKAVSILQAACPDETPITPPGRLEAMEKRLQAMVDAANTVKPELESFYASLSAEQKARFNRIGRQLETTGSSSN